MATPLEFSTMGLPDTERVELWEGHNQDALIGLRCRTLDAPSLEAREINLQLDDVHLARVYGTSHVVERDAELIRRRPADAVAMYFSLVGDAFFYSEDGVRALRPGQLLVCDADRSFMRGFSRGLEELVVKVPRALFRDASGLDDLREPLVLDFGRGGDPHATALAEHVGRATSSSDPVPPDEQAVVELIAVLTSGSTDDLSSAHRAAARAFIERRLRDPRLSATMIADAVGISARHLSRVFAADDTSVPQHVLRRRLDLAHSILTQPAAASMTVAEVARHCGFTSAAHFSHAFVTQHGERASEVRRRAASARAATTGA